MPVSTPASAARRRAALAAALACSLLPALAAAPAARAGGPSFTVRARSGTITLAFTPAAWKAIDGGSATAGTITAPLAPATDATPGTLVFPIARGSLSSATGSGTVSARGGFTTETRVMLPGLIESTTSATAHGPAVAIGRSSTLSLTSPDFTPATVVFFTLGRGRASGGRHAVTVRGIPVRVTAAGVQFFGAPFKVGQRIATLSIQARD